MKFFFAFWHALKVEYGFQCELDDFCGFDGAVLDFLHRTIHQQEEEWLVVSSLYFVLFYANII